LAIPSLTSRALLSVEVIVELRAITYLKDSSGGISNMLDIYITWYLIGLGENLWRKSDYGIKVGRDHSAPESNAGKQNTDPNE
jgi:hypothetical protein